MHNTCYTHEAHTVLTLYLACVSMETQVSHGTQMKRIHCRSTKLEQEIYSGSCILLVTKTEFFFYVTKARSFLQGWHLAHSLWTRASSLKYARGLVVLNKIIARTHDWCYWIALLASPVVQSSNTVSCVSLSFRTHPCVLAFITYILCTNGIEMAFV